MKYNTYKNYLNHLVIKEDKLPAKVVAPKKVQPKKTVEAKDKTDTTTVNTIKDKTKDILKKSTPYTIYSAGKQLIQKYGKK